MSPATLVVILVVGVLLVVGGLILAGGIRQASRMCPYAGCHHRNPLEARFCGKCGGSLNPDNAPPSA